VKGLNKGRKNMSSHNKQPNQETKSSMIKRTKRLAFPEFKIGKLRILTLLMAAFALICLFGQPALATMIANPDSNTVDEDTSLNVPPLGVLSNDGWDGMASVTTTSPFSTAKGANVDMNATGDYSYDPNGQFEFLGVGESDTDSFSYEAKDDSDGSTAISMVTITVTGVNDLPTDISLNSTTINENGAVGRVVGSFSTSDVDTNDSHSYTLVAGAGDTDNASFTIAADQLQTAEVFDYETKNSYL
jgi:VCBS repeat-containing protein